MSTKNRYSEKAGLFVHGCRLLYATSLKDQLRADSAFRQETIFFLCFSQMLETMLYPICFCLKTMKNLYYAILNFGFVLL